MFPPLPALKLKGISLSVVILCISFLSQANHHVSNADDKEWGIAFGLRSATIPYASVNDSVEDIFPLFFYEGEHFYLDGLTAGFKAWNSEQLELSLLARYRFFDIPSEFQNTIRGDGADYGLAGKWEYNADTFLNLELLSDDRGQAHANLGWSQKAHYGKLFIEPYLNAHWKSSDFNTRYFGLEQQHLSSDIDLKLGVKARYHAWQDLYLIGHLGTTAFGSKTRHSELMDDRFQPEVFLGFGFFNPQQINPQASWPRGYLRIAHDWGTPSNLNEILTFAAERDEYNNQLTSFFYGHYLTDSLLGFPLDVYLTPGIAWHHSSEVQDTFAEYILGFKAYYTFQHKYRWRLGVAEGLSYSSEISYIEQEEMDEKGYTPSNLLNYLDFSIDMNLGDIFKEPDLDQWWFGYNIHHRSAIFESSSLFGRIKGGSNYHGLHIQCHW